MLDHPTINKLTDDTEAVATIERVLINEHCHRWGGLMVHDSCLDVQSDSGEVDVKVLRCFSCGELIDPTILRNRMRDSKVSIEIGGLPKSHFSRSKKPVHSNSLMMQVLETWSAAIHQDERQSDTVAN